MKTTAQINIERLSKDDRARLEGMRLALHQIRADVEGMRQRYEGGLHTQLDRLELELLDAIHAADFVLGDSLELLSGPAKLEPIVKSSV
jgi:hypothetical protein